MTNFIFYHNPTLTLVCLPAGSPAIYSLDTAAHLTGVQADTLRYYCRLGLLGAQRAAGEPSFDDNALYEVRRIEHHRRHLGVNWRTLPLLCELWREIDRLQTELRFHRGP